MRIAAAMVAVLVAAGGLAALGLSGRWSRGGRRTSCTVFVDDGVVGHLPEVCGVTGAPADRRIRLEQPVTTLNPLLLLLLILGPIGVAALVVAWVVQRAGGTITAVLPVSSASLDRFQRAVRLRWIGWAMILLGVLAMVVPVTSSTPGTDELATAIAISWVALAAALIVLGHVRALAESVRISVDGSRRWMTLHGVHPDFAAAVHASASVRSTG